MAQHARERPSLEVKLLDGIIPGVALRRRVALEHVEQANLAKHAMLLKEIQMHQRGIEAVAGGFEGVTRFTHRTSRYVSVMPKSTLASSQRRIFIRSVSPEM